VKDADEREGVVVVWTSEHSVEAVATPEAVWGLWSDVASWPRFDDGIERVELAGPFEVGSEGALTPVGGEPLPFRLVAVRPLEGFTDETELPGAVLRFRHRLERLGGGRVRITHAFEFDGPAAQELGAAMGEEMSAGIPASLAALARLAGAPEGEPA
jgi:hypothetical protein